MTTTTLSEETQKQRAKVEKTINALDFNDQDWEVHYFQYGDDVYPGDYNYVEFKRTDEAAVQERNATVRPSGQREVLAYQVNVDHEGKLLTVYALTDRSDQNYRTRFTPYRSKGVRQTWKWVESLLNACGASVDAEKARKEAEAKQAAQDAQDRHEARVKAFIQGEAQDDSSRVIFGLGYAQRNANEALEKVVSNAQAMIDRLQKLVAYATRTEEEGGPYLDNFSLDVLDRPMAELLRAAGHYQAFTELARSTVLGEFLASDEVKSRRYW